MNRNFKDMPTIFFLPQISPIALIFSVKSAKSVLGFH